MVKTVTFDLDGVYFTADSFQRFKAALPKKVTAEDRVIWVLYKSPEMLAFKSGQLLESDYWAFAKKELGITITNAEIFKLLRDSYTVDPQVHEYARQIRSQGLTTCICSNNFITRIRELDAKFSFLEDFTVRVFSYEVGALKPDRRIFAELVRQSGVRPQEIVYSDDDPGKLQGALDLGINAFVYTGFADFTSRVDRLIGQPA